MNLSSVFVLRALLAALFLAHAVQIWGPLRLNTDAEHFLVAAAAAADSAQGFPVAASQPHPPGYATMLALLERSNLARTPVLVLVNLGFVAAGILAAFGVLRRAFGFSEQGALIVCAMTLLSFVIVKHAPIPLSDIPFFGVAMAALYALVRAEAAERTRWLWLGFALLLCAGAIALRTIGVALLPALVWAACGKRRQLSVALLAGGCVLGVLALSQSAYASYAMRQFSSGGAWGTIGAGRLREFGELALNLPSARLPGSLAPLLWLGGLALLCAVVVGLAFWKSGGVVEIFLAAFALILVVWPAEDTRFWLPVVPLLIAVAWMGMNELPKLFVVTWAGVYVVTGVAALVFSMSLSLSGSRFGERYGNGSQRNAYRAALNKQPAPAETDKEALAVLLRFEPRARP